MLTGTDKALVKLYYENFGLSNHEIAATLDLPKPVVDSIITTGGLRPADVIKMEEDKRQALVERDLEKQIALAPYYARAEVVILSKIYDMAEAIDSSDDTASTRLAACAKAYKDIKSSATIAKMEDANGAQGVTVQILNNL